MQLMLALVVVTLAVSGCLAGKPGGAPQSTGQPVVAPPINLANNATACLRGLVAVFLDKTQAQALLPPGFTAADAKDFFALGPAAPTGKAVSLVSVMQCQTSQTQTGGYSEAAAGIFVYAPKVAGLGNVPDNVYELGRTLPPGTVADTLMRAKWPNTASSVTVRYTATPTPAASGDAVAGSATLFSFTAQPAPAADSFREHIRWWHDTPGGLAFFEYDFPVQGYLGPGSCASQPASVFANATQASTCPNGSLFMVGPPFDAKARFEFHPGLRAT